MPRVLVFGTFDGLHPGHRFVLTEAQKRGDVTAIVARDENVQKIKGRASVESEQVRMEAIQKEFPTVTVRLGHESDYLIPVREIQPDLILLGYDQKLPPGVSDNDLPYPVERLPAFEPERYKSSLLRQEGNS